MGLGQLASAFEREAQRGNFLARYEILEATRRAGMRSGRRCALQIKIRRPRQGHSVGSEIKDQDDCCPANHSGEPLAEASPVIGKALEPDQTALSSPTMTHTIQAKQRSNIRIRR